jgi:hypothetical protein
MPRAGFEPPIPMFEWPKTVLAIDRAAIGTGSRDIITINITVQSIQTPSFMVWWLALRFSVQNSAILIEVLRAFPQNLQRNSGILTYST